MANVEKFVPFLIRFEAGVIAPTMTNRQLFEQARKTGFSNDPRDKGGATMIGVTLGAYTTYCRRKGYPCPTVERLRAIPYDHWIDILKSMYWDRWKADQIRSQSVAEILVDWVWASGKYGITIPQRLLDVKVDGIVGAKTIAAVNAADPAGLFERIKTRRYAYIESICKPPSSNIVYKRGWLRRLNAMHYAD